MAILLCRNCIPHEYQDARYGKNKRVQNPTAKAGQYRCTVCSATNGG